MGKVACACIYHNDSARYLKWVIKESELTSIVHMSSNMGVKRGESMLIGNIAELFFWFFWELLLSYTLYITGALVLRVITFGQVSKPLYFPSVFSNEKRLAKNDFFSVYITGFFFYLILLAFLIGLG
ncbi:hypothetical protein [Shewanella sp. VB17]|uniref:hypothetical protein n=1 Tax=Shewanella sp. VB17 TaxID=2739432 RepID=UPI0020B6D7F2|nr:hypothetical protein [Shewanella sp. VB17]